MENKISLLTLCPIFRTKELITEKAKRDKEVEK